MTYIYYTYIIHIHILHLLYLHNLNNICNLLGLKKCKQDTLSKIIYCMNYIRILKFLLSLLYAMLVKLHSR